MKNIIQTIAIVIILLLIGCTPDEGVMPDSNLGKRLKKTLEKTGGIEEYMMPKSFDLAAIPQDPKNPLTPQKVELGKKIYHDTGFNVENVKPQGALTISCASCHHVENSLKSGLAQGIGEGGSGFGRNRVISVGYENDADRQPVRTPTVLNSAYQTEVLWNGALGGTPKNQPFSDRWEGPLAVNFLGYLGVETQAIAGLKVHRMRVDQDLVEKLGYKEAFDNAFPDFPPSERYSNITGGLAIAAYERTLLATESKFQQWLHEGKENMSNDAIEGAILFFDPDQANCVQCHSGPALSDGNFHALGTKDLQNALPGDPAHLGRGGYTLNPDDMFKFKTPTLYNLEGEIFFFHGGVAMTLSEAVRYHVNGRTHEDIDRRQLAPYFLTPPELSNKEIGKIVAFIVEGLQDNSLADQVPDAVNSGLCFPNNDPRSKQQLGCN